MLLRPDYILMFILPEMVGLHSEIMRNKSKVNTHVGYSNVN